MIKFNKLRLINWHYFGNTTIDVDNVTFLTGANGTGKSTVIDALQIVLLGDTTGRNFNKAANEKSGRTLRGYLRGETGEDREGHITCLRNGRFTSYIALGFYDTSNDHSFTLGIVFDSFSDGHDERHFFWLNAPFPKNNFTNADLLDKQSPRPLTFKELDEFFSQNFKSSDYKFFDTNEQYRQFLKEIFGNLPEKYFLLFKKSVSFVPLTDISRFITEFVCDVDYKVDIGPMQNNVEQYRLLENQAGRLRNKVQALTAIHEAYENYIKLKKDMGALTYVTTRVTFEYAKAQMDQFNGQINQHQKALSSIAIELNQIDTQIQELSKEREVYLAKKVASKDFSLSNSLLQQKNEYIQKIASLQLSKQNIEQKIKEYADEFFSVINSVSSAFKNVDLTTLGMDDRQSDNYADFLNASEELRNELEGVKESVLKHALAPESLESLQMDMEAYKTKGTALYSECEQMIYKISQEKNSLSVQIKQVNQGEKPYPEIYKQVLHELTDALKARHPDAYVKVFCDLIDVNDPEWVKAMEACLGSNRFNAFVNPSYFSEAYRILKDLVNTYNFTGLNIIDSEKVMDFVEDHPANFDSVAKLLTTKDEAARAYSDYLLGRIKKCDSFEEARESGFGLLSDCTGYRSFSTWYLRKPQNFFIGTRIDMGNAKGIHDDFQALDKNLSIFNSFRNALYFFVSLPSMSKNEARTYRDDLLKVEEIPNLESNVERLTNQMKEGQLKDVSELDEKIHGIDNDVKSLTQHKEDLISQKGAHEHEIQRIQSEVLPTKEAELKKAELELKSKFTEQETSDYSKVYDELREQLSLDKIVTEAQTRYVRYQNRQKAQRDLLLKLRSQYVTIYNLSYDVENDANNDEFDKELQGLQNVLLPQYEKQIAEAHSKAISEFRDDFIFKLRTLIETVHSQIEDLNQALQDVKFGHDSYRFTVEPNKDFIQYYNMIMDPLLLQAGDAEDLFLEKYKDLMNQLFELISDASSGSVEDKERLLENIEKYTDYRTYLVFDLLNKKGEGSEVPWFSMAKTLKSSSGGEAQTPFYISILASFAQLYRTKQDANTLRLAIFDEAFSKMDHDRIQQTFNLIRSLGLQVLISTPPEKLRDLAKFVDETLVTIHKDKEKISYIDLYQDTREKASQVKAVFEKTKEGLGEPMGEDRLPIDTPLKKEEKVEETKPIEEAKSEPTPTPSTPKQA